MGAAAILLAATAVSSVAGRAVGEESLGDLKAKMKSIQEQLDAAAARLTKLEARHHELEDRVAEIEAQREKIERQNAGLEEKVIDRARQLYTSGGTSMVEVLFSSDSFSELTSRAEILSQISLDDSSVFIKLGRAQAELEKLSKQLEMEKTELKATTKEMEAESARLQEKFEEVTDEYRELKRKLAAAAARRAAAAEAAAAAATVPSPAASPVVYVAPDADMVCPVDGPNSFIDSWGYPRSGGRSHQGVDIMAAYGTPIVAIVSGTITHSGWSSLGGHTIYLTGDDGHGYYYMHNQRNIVTSGRVKVGQQIATVGDTGNATGTPHLHFEYHPGGGAAVNPYPLVRPLC